MTNGNGLAKTEQKQAIGPVSLKFDAEALITKAIEKNVPVETMERLLAMRKDLKAEWAKEEYVKAMAGFQADCPVIEKTKKVHTKTGQLAYMYAPIESIVEQVKKHLKNHGFSYSSNMELIENGTTKVKVSIKVTHAAGHSEVTEMTVPLGTQTQIMSQTQVVAAAQTFAKRYAFCNAFGILTGDEDTDARPSDSENAQPKPDAKNGQTPERPTKIHTGTKTAYMSCESCHAPAGKRHATSCKAVS
jgi:hypothetical protein